MKAQRTYNVIATITTKSGQMRPELVEMSAPDGDLLQMTFDCKASRYQQLLTMLKDGGKMTLSHIGSFRFISTKHRLTHIVGDGKKMAISAMIRVTSKVTTHGRMCANTSVRHA